MARAPRQAPWPWYDDDWADSEAERPVEPVVHTDEDRDVVGTLLGRRGAPMRTVKRLDAVPIDYRGRRR